MCDKYDVEDDWNGHEFDTPLNWLGAAICAVCAVAVVALGVLCFIAGYST